MQLCHENLCETIINKHTINCTSRTGIKINTLHYDNVENRFILKMEKSIQATHHMCRLTHYIVRNGTTYNNGIHASMEKLVKELGIP